MSPRRTRTAFLTPLALMVLAVFAILGVTMIFTGTSDYAQSAKTLYGVQANFLCHAVVEEAQTLIYDRFTKPLDALSGAEFDARKQLFTKIKQAVDTAGTQPTGDIDSFDLTGSNAIGTLTTANQLATDMEAEISVARCRLHGFRKFPYSENLQYHNKVKTYSLPLFDDPASPKFDLNDFIGYATIEVKMKLRHQTRRLAVVRDVKVINQTPIGREFALFQSVDLTQDASFNGNIDNEKYIENDLNNKVIGATFNENQPDGNADEQFSGAIRIFGEGWGRIRVKGPLLIESEGFEQGIGGENPFEEALHITDRGPNIRSQAGDKLQTPRPRLISNSFTAPAISPTGTVLDDDKARWYGWSYIPAPRAPKKENSLAGAVGNAFGGAPPGQMRPNEKEPETSFTGVLDRFTPISTIVGTSGDPGFQTAHGEHYYSAFKNATHHDFSLIGNPRGHVGPNQTANAAQDQDRLSMFRGVMATYDRNNPTSDGQPNDRKVYDTVSQPGGSPGKIMVDPGTITGSAGDSSAELKDKSFLIAPEAAISQRVRLYYMQNSALGRSAERAAEQQREFEEREGAVDHILGWFRDRWEDAKDFVTNFSLNYEVQVPPDDTSRDPKLIKGVTTVPYALSWDPNRESGIGGALLNVALSAAILGPVGTIAIRGIVKQALIVSLRGAAIAAGITGVGLTTQSLTSSNTSLDPNGDPNADLPDNSLPHNYKPWFMAATRKYKTLTELEPIAKHPGGDLPVLNLDGIVWIEKLKNQQKPFRYRGRGTLTTRGRDEENPPLTNPTDFSTGIIITGPLRPADTSGTGAGPADPTQAIAPGSEANKPHHLNLTVYAGSGKALDGHHVLTIQGAGSSKVVDVQASVFSMHGVRASRNSNKNIKIIGNLGVGVINKYLMPRPQTKNDINADTPFLHVRYRQGLYLPAGADVTQKLGEGTFQDGSWHTLTFSPRLAGYAQDFPD